MSLIPLKNVSKLFEILFSHSTLNVSFAYGFMDPLQEFLTLGV